MNVQTCVYSRPFKPHQGMKYKTRMCLTCDISLDLAKQGELAAAVTKMQTKEQQVHLNKYRAGNHCKQFVIQYLA